MDSLDNGEIGKRIPVVDPNCLVDHMYQHHHSHGEFGKYRYQHLHAFLVDCDSTWDTSVLNHVSHDNETHLDEPVSVDIKDANVIFASNDVDKLDDSSMPFEDLLSFVQSMTNVLDAAMSDFMHSLTLLIPLFLWHPL
jgi:hypothetical protein